MNAHGIDRLFKQIGLKILDEEQNNNEKNSSGKKRNNSRIKIDKDISKGKSNNNKKCCGI